MKADAEYFAFVDDPVPACPHPADEQMGTRKASENNAAPTVPIVPASDSQGQASGVVLDLGTFEERAAIIEHECGHSRQDAETQAAREEGFDTAADLHQAVVARWATTIDRLAALDGIGPDAAEAIRQAQAFIGEGWALQTASFGWDELDLFGVRVRAPWQRLDRKGTAFGGTVQAVTREAVVYVGGVRRYRATINCDDGEVPIWALGQECIRANKWGEA